MDNEQNDIFDENAKSKNDEKSDPAKGISLKELLKENEALKKLIEKEKKVSKENTKLKKKVKHMLGERDKAMKMIAKWMDKHYDHNKKVKYVKIPKSEFEFLPTVYNRME